MTNESVPPHGEFKYLPGLPPAPVEEILAMQKEREKEHTEQMIRKLNDNPFVPAGMFTIFIFIGLFVLKFLGCLATAGILTYGLISMRRGNQYQSQMLMRARVVAQGVTVAFLLGGAILYAPKR